MIITVFLNYHKKLKFYVNSVKSKLMSLIKSQKRIKKQIEDSRIKAKNSNNEDVGCIFLGNFEIIL